MNACTAAQEPPLHSLAHTPPLDFRAMAESMASRALRNLYGEDATLEELFGSASGGVLWQQILATYEDPPGVRQDVEWFRPDGTRSFTKNVDNQRNFRVVEKRLKTSLKLHGWVGNVRGGVVGVWSLGRSFPIQTLTAGQLTTAYYAALEEEPDNEQLKMSTCVHNVIVLHERTPRCVRIWIRDYFNQFHGGAGVSFIELLEEATIDESAWHCYCRGRGITVRSGEDGVSYERAYIMWFNRNNTKDQKFDD